MRNFVRHFIRRDVSAGCIALWAILGVARGQQTTSEKLVQCNDPAQITYPVLISNVAVGSKSVECGLFVKPPSVVQPVTPFQAGNDWLQQMTISLVNRTEKTIVAGTVSLMFLDNAADCRTQVCPMEQIHLGQMPAVDAYDGRTGKPLRSEHPERTPLNWKHGQIFTVRIGDYLNEIGAKPLNYEPVTTVSKVAVHVGPFFFEDGMRWSAGRYSTPVSETPGKFEYLPENYFPGKRGSNWPPGFSQ